MLSSLLTHEPFSREYPHMKTSLKDALIEALLGWLGLPFRFLIENSEVAARIATVSSTLRNFPLLVDPIEDPNNPGELLLYSSATGFSGSAGSAGSPGQGFAEISEPAD